METVINLAESAFDMFILLIYFKAMLINRKKKVPNILFYGSFVLMEIALSVTFFFLADIHTTLRFFITVIVSVTTTYLLTFFYDAPLTHKLFVTISFQVYCNISESIVYYAYIFYLQMTGLSYGAGDYIMNFITKIITFIMIVITFLIMNPKKNNYSIQYSLLILLTPVVSIITMLAVGYPDIESPQSLALQIAAVVGLIFLNIANYFLLNNLILSKELKAKEEQLLQQIKYQSEKYEMISVAYRDTRRLIHDTKKHYFFIKNALQKQKNEIICDYIDKELSALDNKHITVNCGNLVIDSFVGYYIQLAGQESITFDTKIRISPQLVPLDDYDLCIIIGNLLENSIKASRNIHILTKRNILFEAYTSETEFVLHISNAVSETPYSSNSSGDNADLYHGFGIENVEKTVEKYEGVYTHERKYGRYSSIIVIPLKV